MASPPPNPDTRVLPSGWIQQYNWEYKQWFYVNTRENPPRSSWEHPLGLQAFAPPPGAPGRSPYDPPPPGYGGYQPYAPPPQGYYNSPPGGYAPYASNNRGYPQEQVVYEDDRRNRKKGGGAGLGTALLAGGAGLAGGVLLTEAFESHNEYEREQGFDQGFQDGYADGYDDGGGFF